MRDEAEYGKRTGRLVKTLHTDVAKFKDSGQAANPSRLQIQGIQGLLEALPKPKLKLTPKTLN